MGQVRVSVKLEDFFIRKDNEASDDEPFLVVAYARLDGALLDPDVPVAGRRVPIHFPSKQGHGDLGPASADMSAPGGGAKSRIAVPAAIGEWEATLDSSFMDFSPALMGRACGVVVAVVFMEEDATADSIALDALEEAKVEVRRQANERLQAFLADPAAADRLDPDQFIDSEAIQNAALSILPAEIGKAIAKSFLTPFLGPFFFVGALAQADHDDYVGRDTRFISFYALVGRAHEKISFELDSVTINTMEDLEEIIGRELPDFIVDEAGDYRVNGYAQRTDVDEPPIVAVIAGPNQSIRCFARRTDGDFFQCFRADDFDGALQGVANWRPSSGVFHSGPGAAASADGQKQWVMGRGTDDNFWHVLSEDGGNQWSDWAPLKGGGRFKSAPSVAMSPDGRHVYVVGRGLDDRYYFTMSSDEGINWKPWTVIGQGVFRSTPAIVCIREQETVITLPGQPNRPRRHSLVAAGLGTDKQVYVCRFADSADLEKVVWKPIDKTNHRFNSAPALAVDGAGKHVTCVCRGRDLRYLELRSADGGHTFGVGFSWRGFGLPERGRVRYTEGGSRRGDLQQMYSAPAALISDGALERRVFGLSTTLGLWRNFSSPGAHKLWRPLDEEPEPTLRAHFY